MDHEERSRMDGSFGIGSADGDQIISGDATDHYFTKRAIGPFFDFMIRT